MTTIGKGILRWVWCIPEKSIKETLSPPPRITKNQKVNGQMAQAPLFVIFLTIWDKSHETHKGKKNVYIISGKQSEGFRSRRELSLTPLHLECRELCTTARQSTIKWVCVHIKVEWDYIPWSALLPQSHSATFMRSPKDIQGPSISSWQIFLYIITKWHALYAIPCQNVRNQVKLQLHATFSTFSKWHYLSFPMQSDYQELYVAH